MLSLALFALLPLGLATPVTTSTKIVPTTTSTSVSPFATTTDWPSVPKGAVFYDPPAYEGRGRRLHPLGRADLCLTVQQEDNQIKSGAAVEISYCFSNDSPYSDFQLWQPFGDVQFVDQYLTLGNTTRVLDAVDGELVLNEVGIHDQGQKWSLSTKGYLAVDGKCLTFKEGSKPDCALPWGKVRDVKMEQCQGGAPNQVFYFLPLEEEVLIDY